MEPRTDVQKYKCDNMKLNSNHRLAFFGKLTLLAVLLTSLFTGIANAQTTVTIGSGTTTSYYLPIGNYFNYSYTQQIYLASEIGAAGAPQYITDLAFQWGYGTATTNKNNCTIYMANTPKTSFANSTDWVQFADMTPVYTGPVNFAAPAGTWTNFSLSTPFYYDGTSNLLVCVHDNSGAYAGNSYVSYNSTSPNSNMGMYIQNDGSAYTINPTFSSGGSMLSYRTNAKFTYIPAGGCPPYNPPSPDITGYSFSTGVGTASDWLSPATTYSSLTSGDDNASSLSNLGFTFNFEGTPYTQFSVNTNGQLRLGSTVITASPYSTPFGSGNESSNNPKIIGIGADLYGTTLTYGVSGTAPNRIGVFTYYGYRLGYSSDQFYFKVNLYEATGQIKIIYDNSPSTPPNSYQVGIVGASSSNVVTVNPSSHTKADGPSTTTYSVWPGQYRYYSFTPPLVSNCVPPYNLEIVGDTLFWTECDSSTAWVVEYAPAGSPQGSGTRIVVNNTPRYNFSSLPAGMYSFWVRSLCGPGDTSVYRGPVVVIHNYNFCGGDGTQANPYLICNEQDLRNFSLCVNSGLPFTGQYFRLVNNIAMAMGPFDPIGNPNTPFRGHFDGNNRSITNLTMTNATNDHNGLFGMIIGGSIHHLTVGGTIAGGDTTGGIVASAVNSVISNCVNNATISGAYRAHGGIAGSITDSKILDCRNTGTIADNAYEHGGIVGDAFNKSVIRRCVNTGTITGANSNSSNYYHGGIVGRFYNNAASGDTVGIFACRNTVPIGGYYYTGGIAGYMYYANADSCFNTGAVSGYYYTGGITGYAYYSKFRRSSNRGNVTSTYYYIGGIVGYLYGASATYAYVQYCVNTGHVSQTGTGGYYVGGIAGYIYYTYLDYNTNSGDVLSNCTANTSYVGGIVGSASTYGYIRYNLNGGYVKSYGGYVGGIVGNSYGSTYTIYNLNVNNVKGGSFTAAIAGYGAAGTNNYWDKQMCPSTILYQGTVNASCAKTTAQLLGVATYPGTAYFTAMTGMYPIPTGMRDSLGSKLAATPINLNGTDDVDDVKTSFPVSTLNSVAWTSSDPSVISVSGANATKRGSGVTTFTGATGGMQKHIMLVVMPTDFCGGSGTQADPWLICRHQTLDSLAMFVNMGIPFTGKYFKQVSDLDLNSYSNWSVIGSTTTTPFKGHYDGNNKTIENLNITGTTQYRGLFGVVLGLSQTDKASIHHLTVKGNVAGGNYTGGIVGFADNADFKKLTNYAKVTSTSYSYHGGVAGYTNYYCRFDSCFNYGEIAGSSYTGGITGGLYYYGSIRNSQNHGDVAGSSYSGGIVGYPYYYDTIVDCKNTGGVTTTASYVGGIAGYKYYYGYIEDCDNTGNVKGSSYLGGIVGYMYYQQFIKNCNNSGSVTGTSSYIGGIAGYYYSGQSSLTSIYEIRNCHNRGSVTAASTYAGGIVGYAAYCRTRFCNNYGSVQSTSYGVGGIV